MFGQEAREVLALAALICSTEALVIARRSNSSRSLHPRQMRVADAPLNHFISQSSISAASSAPEWKRAN
jgi:hypothetical protein